MDRTAGTLNRRYWIAVAIMFVLYLATLVGVGRMPIASSGEIRLWSMSPSSQQIFDYYTLSHIIYGFLFYALLYLVARRLPLATRFVAALLIECGWEIVENTDFVIDRYRDSTASPNYYRATILNSMSDVCSMALVFLVAGKLPVWATLVLFVFFELLKLYLIRDNLVLNIIMLLHPIEGIRQWQLQEP